MGELNELNELYKDCLSKFPELKGVPKLKVEKTRDRLEGAKGRDGDGRTVIILWIPEKIWGNWDMVKPIILHELSHCINLQEPDGVFYERADEKSKLLWDKLTESKTIKCEYIAPHNGVGE